MKVFLITTGTVFGLITVAHVLRFFAEGPHLAREPLFMLLAVVPAALSLWAWRLLWTSRRRS
jgi:hypothetical protein